jgi:acyl carrier protein
MSHEETITNRVASIVAINTGYDPEELAADAHFEDDLGMTKPDFIRVIAKINKEFEISLHAGALYEEISTVEELAALVEDEKLWG